MQRRHLLTAATTGLAASLAGCTGSLPSSCGDVPYDYEWDATPYFDADSNIVVVVEGELVNRSDDCGLDAVEVSVDAVDSTGATVLSKSMVVRQIGPRDEEHWLVRFHPSREEATSIDNYDVSAARITTDE